MNNIYVFLKKNLLVISIFMLALLIRLYAYKNTILINTDSVAYILQANFIYSGQFEIAKKCGYTFISSYPFLCIPFYLIFKDWILACSLTSITFGMATSIILYLILIRFFSKEVSTILIAIFLFNPLFVQENTEIMKDTTFWFFLVSAIFFFIHALDKKINLYLLLSSILYIISIFTRIEGIFFFAGSLIYLLYRKKNIRTILYFGFPLIILVCGLILSLMIKANNISLWDLYIKPRVESFSFMVGEESSLKRLSARLKELNTTVEGVPPKFFIYIKETLWGVAASLLIVKFVAAFYQPFLIFLITGIFGIKRVIKNEPEVKYFVLLTFICIIYLYIFTLQSFIMEKRYTAPLIFSTFFITGNGIENIKSYLQKKGIDEKKILIFMLIFIILITMPVNLKKKRGVHAPIKEIALMVYNEKKDTEFIKVATPDRRINFYINQDKLHYFCSGNEINYERLIKMSYKDLITELKLNKYRYFIWEEKSWKRANYDFLTSYNKNDFEEIGRWKIKDNSLILYRIK